ncbi:hypothetical protein BH23CHL7_BH23CHL7_10950 [soil metagenome]
MAQNNDQQPGDDGEFDEDALYDQFPRGADEGFGPEQGYNRWIVINDPELFTEEARNDPVVRAFLDAPFMLNFAQFKSSHAETEYFIHKPHLAMTGQVDGIEGEVAGFPEEAHISTLVMNHEATLAKLETRSLTIADGKHVGQLVHKQEPEPD